LQEYDRRRELTKKTRFNSWLREISPAPEWNWTWPHIVYTIFLLEKLAAGEIKKLMIFEPPRHGKSELSSVRFPAWLLERNSSTRIIVGSYNQQLANTFSRKTRRICEGRITFSKDRTAVEDWETVSDGGYKAVGVGSGVTGRGANGLIIDDPVKSREEANSKTYRDRCWDWYKEDLYTRLEPGAWELLQMTRWHQDDLAGRILASEDGPNWTVISLPAFAEADDSLGRAEGEALCPDRFNREELLAIQQVLGSAFQALYQQRPTAIEGSIFKREWWQYYREAPEFSRIVQSWDTAFKKGKENDPSCCLTWGEAKNGYYLLDRWNQRVEYPELKRTAKQANNIWKPNAVLVEDKASGQSLIQELKRETKIPVLAINPDADKVARANSVTPLCEAGKVFLPENASWILEFVDQMATFPNADHDEDADCTSQALSYLARGGTPGLAVVDRNYRPISERTQEQRMTAFFRGD